MNLIINKGLGKAYNLHSVCNKGGSSQSEICAKLEKNLKNTFFMQ